MAVSTRTDEEIQRDVLEELKWDTTVKPNEVGVSVKDGIVTLTGWVDGGIMGNSRDTADSFNGPLTFPDRNGEGQLKQLWLSLDRSAPKDNCGWYLGGHVASRAIGDVAHLGRLIQTLAPELLLNLLLCVLLHLSLSRKYPTTSGGAEQVT